MRYHIMEVLLVMLIESSTTDVSLRDKILCLRFKRNFSVINLITNVELWDCHNKLNEDKFQIFFIYESLCSLRWTVFKLAIN